MKTHLSVVVTLILAGCIACSKGDTSTPTPTPTTTADPIQQLSRNWMLQSVSENLGAGNTVTLYTRGTTKNLLDLSKYRQNLLSTGNYTTTGQSGDTVSKGKWALASKNTQLVLTDDTSPLLNSTFTLDSFSDTAMYLSQHTTDKGFLQQAGIDASSVMYVDIAYVFVPAQ